MKNFLPIVKLACLTAAAALIVSCGDGADYRNVLPADSFVTMSVDAASLLKKSGTCDAASNPLLDRLKAELDKAEELSAEEKEYLFSLLENPAESGLDLKKELFLFMSADGADINNPEVGGGLLFPVGDKSKLDALIARINEKSGTETVTEAGVSVVKIGEESEASGVCAYNDIACLLYFKTDPCGVVEEKVRKLFAQKRAESLMGDKAVAARLAARNDVNLYNYGFAPSQGLPQISEGIFRRVSLGIDIAGNGLTEHFRGRIVGLSNRLNTILVPDAFIRWSNGRFGSRTDEKRPARVIVETDRPVDAAVSEYLARKGYEAEGDRRDDGKATRFLRLAAGGVAGVGMAFSAMSFYVLMLSIFLLLQKNSDKIENLLLLGYAPTRVARPYRLLTFGLNGAVLAAAVLAVWLLRLAYLPSLAALQEGYRPAGMGITLLCGIGLALSLSLLNGLAIRRRIGGTGCGRG